MRLVLVALIARVPFAYAVAVLAAESTDQLMTMRKLVTMRLLLTVRQLLPTLAHAAKR